LNIEVQLEIDFTHSAFERLLDSEEDTSQLKKGFYKKSTLKRDFSLEDFDDFEDEDEPHL
jgi:hypothetical protein